MIKLPIEIGDILLVGRFKNKRIKVKEIGTDEHGLPTVNGRGILKIRIEKLMEPKKNLKEGTMSLKDLENYFYENESDIRDNMKTYGFKLKDISKIRNYMDLASVLGVDSRDVKDVDLRQYTDTLADLLKNEQQESKQLKESIDYDETEVNPSFLIQDNEYVWIMGAEPLLVYYTGRGKKPGTYNFEFKDKKGNHDLSRRDVKEYIKYKEGSAPGPFGYNSGLNKFKQESKQFSLAQTAKKILKENSNEVDQLFKFLDHPWQEDGEIEFVSLLDQNRGNFKTSNWAATLRYLRSMDKANSNLSMMASDKFLTMWDDLIK